MDNRNEKLVKLIQDNPNLPIKFMTANDDLTDFYYTMMNNFDSEIETIYENEEKVYIGEDEAIEYLSDDLSDCEKYIDMTEEEYETEIKKLVNNLKHYEAIIVWVSV